MYVETHQPPEGVRLLDAQRNWKGETVPDLFDSPASPLAFLLPGERREPALTILSGLPGAGKSTWCLRLIEVARARGLVVGGLLSPGVFHNGRKVGIDLMDLVSGERRRLAVRHDAAEGGIRTDSWVLDPGVLAWGNHRLLASPACDLVILDELGPLELEQGGGFQAALRIIESRRFPLIVAVVRPRLLPKARRRWPWGEVISLKSDRTCDSEK
jgi:nucleoside-triphosphatase